jgi:hypothetical protein
MVHRARIRSAAKRVARHCEDIIDVATNPIHYESSGDLPDLVDVVTMEVIELRRVTAEAHPKADMEKMIAKPKIRPMGELMDEEDIRHARGIADGNRDCKLTINEKRLRDSK